MLDVFSNLSQLLIKKATNYDWLELFSVYDKNKDGLLDKIELKQMLADCGMKDITDAEVSFAFNVMSFFQKHLSKKTFNDWINVTLFVKAYSEHDWKTPSNS